MFYQDYAVETILARHILNGCREYKRNIDAVDSYLPMNVEPRFPFTLHLADCACGVRLDPKQGEHAAQAEWIKHVSSMMRLASQ